MTPPPDKGSHPVVVELDREVAEHVAKYGAATKCDCAKCEVLVEAVTKALSSTAEAEGSDG